jgi:hypothetical protein
MDELLWDLTKLPEKEWVTSTMRSRNYETNAGKHRCKLGNSTQRFRYWKDWLGATHLYYVASDAVVCFLQLRASVRNGEIKSEKGLFTKHQNRIIVPDDRRYF